MWRNRNAGRKKGTANKPTQALVELLKANDFSPVDELLKIIRADNLRSQLSPKEKADVILKLMEYIYPKRTSVAVDLSVEMKPKKFEDYIHEIEQGEV